MAHRHHHIGWLVAAGVALALGVIAAAQSLDPATLLKPPADSWPTYHGDYSGQRHSALTQITPANVHQMTLAWAFQTGQTQQIKATPILVDGVIYVTDARQRLGGRRAHRPAALALHAIRRTMGFTSAIAASPIYKDFVYPRPRPTRTCRARRAGRQGPLECRRSPTPSAATGRRTRRSLIRNHLIVGVSGDFDNLPGILSRSIRRPARRSGPSTARRPPGRPARSSGGATGGQMWMTGTYDPELNLLYVGTGNPTPVLNGEVRPGDNPWTCSIVALNPDTGKLAWGFQASPHDTHDWDAAEVPVLVDAAFQRRAAEAAAAGVAQRLFLRAGSDQRQEPADHAVRDGELGQRHRQGRPADSESRQGSGARRPAGCAQRGRRHQLPLAELRSRGRPASSSALRMRYGIYFFKPEHGAYGWAGADYGVHGHGAFAPSTTGPENALEPRSRRRRLRRGSADHGSGLRLPAIPPATRWRFAPLTARRSGTRASGVWALARSPTSSTAASTC